MKQNSVSVFRIIKAPASSVFKAWTEPKVLELWMVSKAKVEPKVGGKFRFETEDGADIHLVTGQFQEFVPGRRLAMSWIYEGPASPTRLESLVSITITESSKGAVKLTVNESGPALEDQTSQDSSKEVWTSVLKNLETLLISVLR